MMRPGRGIADRERAAQSRPSLPRRLAPPELHGNGIAFATLLSLLLWALLIIAALHLVARILP